MKRDGDILACLHSFSLSNKEAAAFMATVLRHLAGLFPVFCLSAYIQSH